MLIANNKFIFIHLQKTGGSFIKKVIPKIDVCVHSANGHPTIHAYYHERRKLREHNAKEYKDFCNNHLIFSVIRNPWSFYVSMWKFLTSYIGIDNRTLSGYFPNIKGVDILKKMDINNFVKHIFEYENHVSSGYLMNFENYQDLNVGLYTYEFLRLFSHRKEYITIELIGEIPNQIYLEDINNLCVDRFLRFENLSIELANLMKEIFDISNEQYDLIKNYKKINESDYSRARNFQTRYFNMKQKSTKTFNIDLLKLYSAKKEKYQDYYDNDTIELIYKKDKLIIEKFNYSY